MSEHLSGLRRHQSNKKENFAKFFDPKQVWVPVLEVAPVSLDTIARLHLARIERRLATGAA
ncbi:MAG: hypothetical protein WB463_21025, partial [Pseudolabrys sp.]